jgi:hypothetical protein
MRKLGELRLGVRSRTKPPMQLFWANLANFDGPHQFAIEYQTADFLRRDASQVRQLAAHLAVVKVKKNFSKVKIQKPRLAHCVSF